MRRAAKERTAVLCATLLGFALGTPFAEDPPEGVVVRGPYLQAVVAESAAIVWLTAEPSVGRVRYAPEGKPEEASEVAEGESATSHLVELVGLSPDTVYHYEILAGNEVLAGGDGLEFRTAPPRNEGTFRAAVIGDSGSGSAEQRAVATLVRTMDPDLFLHTGDLIYTQTIDPIIFTPYREILTRSCFYPARGNHDQPSAFDNVRWRVVFPPPPALVDIRDDRVFEAPCCTRPLPEGTPEDGDPAYYSFDWGPAHVAVLDYFGGFEQCARQMRWLCADLARARERELMWLVVVLHEHLYSGGYHSYTEPRTREHLREIIDHYEVDLVLSGHDHNYQRTHPLRNDVPRDAWQDPGFVRPEGTVYLVSGGGGGILYPWYADSVDTEYIQVFHSEYHAVELVVTPTSLQATARTPSGTVLDSFSIEKERPRPALEFLRGDVDFDGEAELTDAVIGLEYLFRGGRTDCPAVFDANGDGELSVTDAVHVLSFLFQGGPPPAPPYPTCDRVPDADDAWCFRASCPGDRAPARPRDPGQ